MMVAVWLTVLLMHTVRRGTAWLWLAYAIGLAFATLLDIYLVLLWVAHAVVILAFHRTRRALAGFGISSALTIAAMAPFMAVVVGQVHQISWITPIGRRTIEDVAVQQYFDRNPIFALLSGLVIAAAVTLWLSKLRRAGAGDRQLIVLAIAWATIPTAVIVLWSSVAHAIYTPRYLAFTAPAIALLLGVCIGALATAPWLSTAVVAVFVIATVPSYVGAQRNPYAKYGMDYSQVADLITAQAAPGDCLLVNDTVTFHPAPMRPLMAARPDAYRKLVDVSLWQRATERRDVFDTNLIPQASVGPLSQCKELWIITQADKSLPAHEQGAPMAPGPQFGNTWTFAVTHDMGFWLLERWQFNLVQVVKAERV
jgi:mannosyltransferase